MYMIIAYLNCVLKYIETLVINSMSRFVRGKLFLPFIRFRYIVILILYCMMCVNIKKRTMQRKCILMNTLY